MVCELVDGVSREPVLVNKHVILSWLVCTWVRVRLEKELRKVSDLYNLRNVNNQNIRTTQCKLWGEHTIIRMYLYIHVYRCEQKNKVKHIHIVTVIPNILSDFV